jgi:hypothetical protein
MFMNIGNAITQYIVDMWAEIHGQAAGAIEDEDEVTAQFGDGTEGIRRGQRRNGLRVARKGR